MSSRTSTAQNKLVALDTAVKNTKIDSGDGITIYFHTIDRLCNATGSTDPLKRLRGQFDRFRQGGTVLPHRGQAQPPSVPVYRISVRVDGPRNSQNFLQTTVSL
ncbi:hypothetical protein ACRAWF_01910 [Streptomyces sp. L7]